MTYPEFYLSQVFKDNAGEKSIVNYTNLLVKYMPELKTLKTKITFTNDEYRKYRFNPKVLSYDLYGTTEFWFLILDINELRSVTEFDLRTAYVMRGDIVDKLSRVLNLEVVSKSYNAEVVASDLLK